MNPSVLTMQMGGCFLCLLFVLSTMYASVRRRFEPDQIPVEGEYNIGQIEFCGPQIR